MRVKIARQIDGTYTVSFWIVNRWVKGCRRWNSYEAAANQITDDYPEAEIEVYNYE